MASRPMNPDAIATMLEDDFDSDQCSIDSAHSMHDSISDISSSSDESSHNFAALPAPRHAVQSRTAPRGRGRPLDNQPQAAPRGRGRPLDNLPQAAPRGRGRPLDNQPQASNPSSGNIWSHDAMPPPNFTFNENSGLQNQQSCASVGDFIDLFFTPHFMQYLVDETNRYAAQEINKMRPLRRTSRVNTWKDTDIKEMKSFIGLMLHMGANNLPSVAHYWNTNTLYNPPLWRKIMSRNRFQLLLHFWHFVDNETSDNHRLHKIMPIMKHFNETMDKVYKPTRNLCIDESMVLWRGRLVFRQYIKNKSHKYGIKLYELCESRGIILRFQIYSGKGPEEIDNGMGYAGNVVLNLMKGFLDKGYALFTDNFYNSVCLTKYLTKRKTYLCGTLRKTRRENPKELVEKKLKRGECEWLRSDSVSICKWKDKRDVLTISNMHSVEMVDVSNRNGIISRKPNIIRDYNKGMSGIDISDQMMSYYSSLRKTLRWYKKIGLHIIEMFILNAYFFYCDKTQSKVTSLQFREHVIVHMLGGSVPDSVVSRRSTNCPDNPPTMHYLGSIPPTPKKSNPTKPCRICTRNGCRRESRYQCMVCAEKPALCIDNCFKIYHQ